MNTKKKTERTFLNTHISRRSRDKTKQLLEINIYKKLYINQSQYKKNI